MAEQEQVLGKVAVRKLATKDDFYVDEENPLPVTVAGGGGGRQIPGATTQDPLGPGTGAGTSFTTDWFEVEGVGVLSFYAITDQPFTTAKLEWSDDGVNVNTDTESVIDFTEAERLISGVYIYYPRPETYLVAPYARIVLENTGTDQNLLNAWLWSFPVGANPFTFLDLDATPSPLEKALLTRQISPALDIVQWTDSDDGTIPSGAAVTIDPVLNTEPNVLDSGWINTATFAGKNIVNVLADASLKIFLMNASDDQGSNIFGNLVPTLNTTPGSPAQLSALYADRFFRIVVCNDSGSSLTNYSIRCEAAPESTDGVTTALSQPVFDFFPAKISRSVTTGQQPDGTYVNTPVGGSLPDYDPINETIAAGQTYNGPWDSTTGMTAVAGFLISTAVSGSDGVKLQFSQDGVTADSEFALEYRADDIGNALFFAIPTQGSHFRLCYENGGAPATLTGHIEASPDAFQIPLTGLESSVSQKNIAAIVRSVIAGQDDTGSGTYRNAQITQGGDLHVSVEKSSAPIAPKPADSNDGGIRYSVGTTVVRLDPSPLTNRMMVWVTNGGSKDIRVGMSSALLSAGGGHLLQPGASIYMGVTSNQPVYARSTSGTQSATITQFASSDQANA